MEWKTSFDAPLATPGVSKGLTRLWNALELNRGKRIRKYIIRRAPAARGDSGQC